jgi:hypothetical protein
LTDAGREVLAKIDAVEDPAPDALATLDPVDLKTLKAILDRVAAR